jgi:DNA-directed RNA polymerase specialized sigma24 family protein
MPLSKKTVQELVPMVSKCAKSLSTEAVEELAPMISKYAASLIPRWISTLTDQEIDALVLRHRDHLAFEDIGFALNMSRQGAHYKYRRALAKLPGATRSIFELEDRWFRQKGVHRCHIR